MDPRFCSSELSNALMNQSVSCRLDEAQENSRIYHGEYVTNNGHPKGNAHDEIGVGDVEELLCLTVSVGELEGQEKVCGHLDVLQLRERRALLYAKAHNTSA